MRRKALLAGTTLFFSISIATLSGVGPVGAVEAKPDRTAYIGAADKICQSSNDRLIAAAKEFETHEVAKASGAGSKKTKVAKPEQVAAFLTKVGIEEVTQQLKQLSLLKPPSADSAQISAMLKKAQAALAEIKKDPTKAAYSDPFNKVAKEFASYGFAVCGRKIERPQS